MKKVLLLLAEGFEIYEASVFIDVIGWNLLEGDGTTELFTCGLRKEIKSAFNQKIIVDYTIEEVDAQSFDALAIPGGFDEYAYYDDAYHDTFINLIKSFHTQNKIITTVCVGALPLGKSGLLNNKKGTTYNSPIRQKALKEFGVELINQPIVIDDNIITSCGPSTAVDVAFLLLTHLTNKGNTATVRSLMGF